MKPAEYLDEAKRRLLLSTDYEIAKKAGETPGHIAEMRYGKRAIPLHLAYWLAITLELDPAFVVADLEGQRDQKRAEFWQGFISRARNLAAVVLCTLAWISSGGAGADPAAAGGFRRRLKVA